MRYNIFDENHNSVQDNNINVLCRVCDDNDNIIKDEKIIETKDMGKRKTEARDNNNNIYIYIYIFIYMYDVVFGLLSS
jgi:abortive infection bacteriophage resistance protein